MTADELRAIFCQACTAEPLAEGWLELEKFGLAVAAAEREACLKACKRLRYDDGDGQHVDWYAGIDGCIEVIRMRSNDEVRGGA